MMRTTIALVGAGGKMGCRLTDNFRKAPHDMRYLEVSPAGLDNLRTRGIEHVDVKAAWRTPGANPTRGADPAAQIRRCDSISRGHLALENHDRFPAAALRRIIDDIGSPAIGVCLDTANSLGAGEGLEHVAALLPPSR